MEEISVSSRERWDRGLDGGLFRSGLGPVATSSVAILVHVGREVCPQTNSVSAWSWAGPFEGRRGVNVTWVQPPGPHARAPPSRASCQEGRLTKVPRS